MQRRTRLDLAHARTYQDREDQAKDAWTHVGAAFVGEDALSFVLHYVPTSTDEGRLKFSVFPPKQDGEPGALPDGLPDRFDVLHPRQFQRGEETATAWTKIGVAFRNGHTSITVLLDYAPSSRADGSIRCILKEPSDRSDGQRRDDDSHEEDDDADLEATG